MSVLHLGIENEDPVTIAPPAGWRPNPDGYAHGGDQSWLPTRFKRSSGCGGAAAVNILAYTLLRRNGDPKRVVRAEDWLRLFERHMGRSRFAGFIPFAWLFAVLVKRSLRREGIAARCHNVSTLSCDCERARAELKTALYGGCPVALQTWLSFSENIRSWHWVTVTAMDQTPERTLLRVSSWGRDYTYDLRQVWRGKASMVWFSEE